jgi:hypothetical protein
MHLENLIYKIYSVHVIRQSINSIQKMRYATQMNAQRLLHFNGEYLVVSSIN